MGLPMFDSQNWVMSSVLGLDDGVCFQELLPQTTQIHQLLEPYSSSIIGSFPSMELSHILGCELRQQSLEMDWIIHLQNEKLRMALKEASRKQAMILHEYESRMMNIMQQKEKDLTIARSKRMELEDCLMNTETEVKEWQKMAMENEATASDLNRKLNEARERSQFSSNAVQDAESWCNYCLISKENRDEAEAENRDLEETVLVMKGEEAEQSKRRRMTATACCKLCNSRMACVVFLPCSHLCTCKPCEPILVCCPVCESVKSGSIEVQLV